MKKLWLKSQGSESNFSHSTRCTVFSLKFVFRLSKSPAQILIRWSVQHGFITIFKTSDEARLKSNADVFDWFIPDEDMKILVINSARHGP